MFPLITISALIDSINPCAISVLFITIAFLMSLGKVRQDIVQIGGTYIFGIFVIYVLIGLGVLKALSFFGTPHFMARIGAGVLIIFGTLELINYFFPSFPIKLKIPNSAHGTMARFMEKGSVPAAFILGALVGMYEFPCTGGPYLLVLGLLHDGATFLQGFFYLAWYNIVFVAPLVAILLIASNRTVFEKVQAWRKENVSGMQLWTGMAFIVLAVLILVL
jgi:cytochrome c biogenesis protein CcdA